MFNYIIWLLTAILYSPVVYQLYRSRWEIIDYTHAYFILPVSLFLAWRKRKDLSALLKKDQKRGQTPFSGQAPFYIFPSLLVIGILLFILGWRNDYLSLTAGSMIPVLTGLIGFLYGPKAVRTLAFPIAYLALMIPPPLGILDAITLPMRYGISAVAGGILKSFHYPVMRQGLLLYIGNQEIFMGAPCSGFRSLITMISLGLAYIHILKETRMNKFIILLSVVPLALFGNLLRVLSLCLVTYYFGQEAGQGFFHDFSGIIVFVIMILGLLGIEAYLKMKRAIHEES